MPHYAKLMETNNPATPANKRKPYGTAERIKPQGDALRLSDFVANTHVWIQLFTDHLPQFAALDPDFTPGYADNWQTLCHQLAATTPDETMRDELAHRHSELLKTQQHFMGYANDLEYYLKKAFATDPRKIDELGIKLLRKDLGKNTLRFNLCATVLATYATRYQTELTTAGLPLTWWAETETAAARCQAAEIHHETGKRERIHLTTQRIEQFNALHKIWQRVNQASKVIYRGNPTLLQLWHWK